ncbi:hypothetical protein Tco_1140077 [Tanacetum coccineum]
MPQSPSLYNKSPTTATSSSSIPRSPSSKPEFKVNPNKQVIQILEPIEEQKLSQRFSSLMDYIFPQNTNFYNNDYQTREYYEAVLIDSQSVQIRHNYNKEDQRKIDFSKSLALRNFNLEDIELKSTNSGPIAKLSILKLGEYEIWAMRIKQDFQIQDYALWEVIENGDSWVLISQTTEENRITTSKVSTPATTEEKIKRKNDVKARGLLLMELPNEHQLTFSQYPDAKSMFAAIETRFRGNEATKKTQKTLLNQQCENFSATSTESLDSIFNRL